MRSCSDVVSPKSWEFNLIKYQAVDGVVFGM